MIDFYKQLDLATLKYRQLSLEKLEEQLLSVRSHFLLDRNINNQFAFESKYAISSRLLENACNVSGDFDSANRYAHEIWGSDVVSSMQRWRDLTPYVLMLQRGRQYKTLLELC